MKKLLSILLSTILIFSLVACGTPKPEETVIAFCENLKELNYAEASALFEFGKGGFEDIEDTDASNAMPEGVEEFFKELAKDIDYKISNVSIEDDIAYVTVTFNYADISPVMSNVLVDFIGQAFALAFSGADESATDALFTSLFTEKMTTTTLNTSTADVEFVCVKKEGEWKLQAFDEDNLIKIENVISFDINKAFDMFNNITLK